MKCPACGHSDKTLFFCAKCWEKLPGKERVALGQMHWKKQDTTSKVAKCLRILKEKAANPDGLR